MAPPRRMMIPEELRVLRRRCNVTQQQLANYLDVSRRTVVRWEQGEMAIPVAVALALGQEPVQEDLRAINGINLPLWQHQPTRPRRRPRQHEGVQGTLTEERIPDGDAPVALE